MTGTGASDASRHTGAVLEQRARELARPIEPGRPAGQDVLGFTVAGQRYALPVASVSRVLPSAPLARVPLSRPSLLGVMNVRGSLLAVFALGDAAQEQAPGQRPGWVVVVGEDLGLAADAVTGIAPLDPDELVELPDPSTDRPTGHLRGLTADGVAVLDADRLLSADRFRPHAETTVTQDREQP